MRLPSHDKVETFAPLLMPRPELRCWRGVVIAAVL